MSWSRLATQINISATAMDVYRTLQIFGTLKRSLRWTDWALSKIPMLCTVATYICLTHQKTGADSLCRVSIFVYLFAVSNSAFGFLINDYGDRDADQIAGKSNTCNHFGIKRMSLIGSFVIAVMLGSSIPFVQNPWFLLFWICALALSLAYSLPPLRLKERGIIGIVASTAAQSTFPVLTTFAALNINDLSECTLLTLIATITGGTLEIAHQQLDHDKDSGSETMTFAVKVGTRQIRKIFDQALWFDRSAVGLLTFIVAKHEWTTDILSLQSLAAIGLLLLYAVLLTLSIYKSFRGGFNDPYFGNRGFLERVLHNVLPNFLIPASILLNLALIAPIWYGLLMWFVAWRLMLYLG